MSTTQINHKKCERLVREMFRLEKVTDLQEKNRAFSKMHMESTEQEWSLVIDQYHAKHPLRELLISERV